MEKDCDDLDLRGALAGYERSLESAVGMRFEMIRGSDASMEIYDLLADPNEHHALTPGDVAPAVLEGLQARIAESEAGAAMAPAEPAAASPDERTTESLRSLGYLQ